MGALQPGLPNPAIIPENWHLLIIDLKDCFFTIALHEDDKPRFAFTLLAINRESPDQRFEWTVLPQAPLSPHCRAREAHTIFHQNAKGLQKAYGIALEEAKAIVKACPVCSYHNQGIGLGLGV
ncbi:POK9 protein, partial [Nyctiprogne leucopyga]|nr:POK9 protein [Nyctiprogne leucopyga]